MTEEEIRVYLSEFVGEAAKGDYPGCLMDASDLKEMNKEQLLEVAVDLGFNPDEWDVDDVEEDED